MIVAALAALIVGYLLGSIPFGVLLTRWAGAGDLRSIGSGNIGATNVLRTGRKGLAAATLLLDALKGTLAVALVVLVWALLVPNPVTIDEASREAYARWGLYATGAAAVGAMLGHCFPVWLGFRGGKGVATYLGILLVIYWFGAFAFAVIWLITAYATRYSSLSALVAVGSAPIIPLIMGQVFVAAVLAVMSALVIYRHADNIRRLASGTERRIGGAA